MDRRKMIELTPDEQRAFLADEKTMTLASVDRRGYPHLVAMWFVVDPDGTVLMTTFAFTGLGDGSSWDDPDNWTNESGYHYVPDNEIRVCMPSRISLSGT